MIKRVRSTLACSYGHANSWILKYSTCSPSINLKVSSLCKQKLFRDALWVFDDLEENTDSPVDSSTYVHLLSACSSLRSVDYGRRIHMHILNSGLIPNMVLENHIVNMYGKCGSIDDSKKVFDSMGEKNVVSWTSLCAGYGQNGMCIEAINFYMKMLQSNVLPNQFTFLHVIKACSGLNEAVLGKQLHAQVIKSEFGSHLIVENALISMYTSYRQISEASKVFCHIKSKDLISWSSMIAAFSKLGYEFEALSCFIEMLSFGIYQPNEFIFGSLFSACATVAQPEFGRQIHGMSIKYGLKGNAFAGCSLADMYAKCGLLCSAKAVFDKIEDPDLVAWNALIAGFSYGGNANEAISVFSQMRLQCAAPDNITVLSLLRGVTLSQGEQLHSYAVKTGLDFDIPVCNALLTMYANCSVHMNAYRIFEEIESNANIVSWNAIITMLLKENQFSDVLALFKKLLISRLRPDQITLSSMLGACGRFNSLEMGDQAYSFVKKLGLEYDILVMNGLIDMYVKCGCLEGARKLFDSAQFLDVASWSTMILGCSQFGFGEETLSLFTRMKNQGIKPNHVTLVAVLNACSHIGLVDEGMQLFNSMEQDYDITPTREHCSCIIDLLSRAGRIHEAEAFINKMNLEPDVVMWKTLLSACKTRGNLEVGKLAAEKILQIDPSNSTAHVLLCSLYASSGGWKDVARIRSSMKEKGVRKVPGQSWIQVKDGIHVFSIEDGLHSERNTIFSLLEQLSLQILNVDVDIDAAPFVLEAV